MKKPELLSPAGTLKNLRYAFAYGADAVYAGQPRYSLRVRNNDFDLENLEIGINEAHALGKKVYVVANIQAHNAKIATFMRDIEPVAALRPDSFIMSDPGLIDLVRGAHPEIPIHLSVQANAVNWATVKFYERIGVSRVILSRELSLEEIREIRDKCPDIELEVFVHGALCMAYSGRCLLSGYINKRDPNQGACTNACRWAYKIRSAKEDDCGAIVPAFTVEEPQHPDEPMTAFEDEHGTYIFNSKDLRAASLVGELSKIGVDSLKIEGRTKSFYYVARTARAYRRAIDDAEAGKAFDPAIDRELDDLANRGYTEGFLVRHRAGDMQNLERGISVSDSATLAGEVIGTADGYLEVAVKNHFEENDRMILLTPSSETHFVLKGMLDKNRENAAIAPGDGHVMLIPRPEGFDASASAERGILMKTGPKAGL